MAVEKVGGTAFVKVDGDQLALEGTLTVDSFDTEREGLSGLSGVVGYKETPRVPSIEVSAFLTSKTNLETLQKVVDGTVTAELANGKVYTLRNAWLAGAPAINGADGTMTIKFEGMKMEQAGAPSS